MRQLPRDVSKSSIATNFGEGFERGAQTNREKLFRIAQHWLPQIIPKDDNATDDFSEELSDFCLFLYRHLLIAKFCWIIVYLSQSRLCVTISEEWWSNITARIYARDTGLKPMLASVTIHWPTLQFFCFWVLTKTSNLPLFVSFPQPSHSIVQIEESGQLHQVLRHHFLIRKSTLLHILEGPRLRAP